MLPAKFPATHIIIPPKGIPKVPALLPELNLQQAVTLDAASHQEIEERLGHIPFFSNLCQTFSGASIFIGHGALSIVGRPFLERTLPYKIQENVWNYCPDRPGFYEVWIQLKEMQSIEELAQMQKGICEHLTDGEHSIIHPCTEDLRCAVVEVYSKTTRFKIMLLLDANPTPLYNLDQCRLRLMHDGKSLSYSLERCTLQNVVDHVAHNLQPLNSHCSAAWYLGRFLASITQRGAVLDSSFLNNYKDVNYEEAFQLGKQALPPGNKALWAYYFNANRSELQMPEIAPESAIEKLIFKYPLADLRSALGIIGALMADLGSKTAHRSNGLLNICIGSDLYLVLPVLQLPIQTDCFCEVLETFVPSSLPSIPYRGDDKYLDGILRSLPLRTRVRFFCLMHASGWNKIDIRDLMDLYFLSCEASSKDELLPIFNELAPYYKETTFAPLFEKLQSVIAEAQTFSTDAVRDTLLLAGLAPLWLDKDVPKSQQLLMNAAAKMHEQMLSLPLNFALKNRQPIAVYCAFVTRLMHASQPLQSSYLPQFMEQLDKLLFEKPELWTELESYPEICKRVSRETQVKHLKCLVQKKASHDKIVALANQLHLTLQDCPELQEQLLCAGVKSFWESSKKAKNLEFLIQNADSLNPDALPWALEKIMEYKGQKENFVRLCTAYLPRVEDPRLIQALEEILRENPSLYENNAVLKGFAVCQIHHHMEHQTPLDQWEGFRRAPLDRSTAVELTNYLINKNRCADEVISLQPSIEESPGLWDFLIRTKRRSRETQIECLRTLLRTGAPPEQTVPFANALDLRAEECPDLREALLLLGVKSIWESSKKVCTADFLLARAESFQPAARTLAAERALDFRSLPVAFIRLCQTFETPRLFQELATVLKENPFLFQNREHQKYLTDVALRQVSSHMESQSPLEEWAVFRSVPVDRAHAVRLINYLIEASAPLEEVLGLNPTPQESPRLLDFLIPHLFEDIRVVDFFIGQGDRRVMDSMHSAECKNTKKYASVLEKLIRTPSFESEAIAIVQKEPSITTHLPLELLRRHFKTDQFWETFALAAIRSESTLEDLLWVGQRVVQHPEVPFRGEYVVCLNKHAKSKKLNGEWPQCLAGLISTSENQSKELFEVALSIEVKSPVRAFLKYCRTVDQVKRATFLQSFYQTGNVPDYIPPKTEEELAKEKVLKLINDNKVDEAFQLMERFSMRDLSIWKKFINIHKDLDDPQKLDRAWNLWLKTHPYEEVQPEYGSAWTSALTLLRTDVFTPSLNKFLDEDALKLLCKLNPDDCKTLTLLVFKVLLMREDINDPVKGIPTFRRMCEILTCKELQTIIGNPSDLFETKNYLSLIFRFIYMKNHLDLRQAGESFLLDYLNNLLGKKHPKNRIEENQRLFEVYKTLIFVPQNEDLQSRLMDWILQDRDYFHTEKLSWSQACTIVRTIKTFTLTSKKRPSLVKDLEALLDKLIRKGQTKYMNILAEESIPYLPSAFVITTQVILDGVKEKGQTPREIIERLSSIRTRVMSKDISTFTSTDTQKTLKLRCACACFQMCDKLPLILAIPTVQDFSKYAHNFDPSSDVEGRFVTKCFFNAIPSFLKLNNSNLNNAIYATLKILIKYQWVQNAPELEFHGWISLLQHLNRFAQEKDCSLENLKFIHQVYQILPPNNCESDFYIKCAHLGSCFISLPAVQAIPLSDWKNHIENAPDFFIVTVCGELSKHCKTEADLSINSSISMARIARFCKSTNLEAIQIVRDGSLLMCNETIDRHNLRNHMELLPEWIHAFSNLFRLEKNDEALGVLSSLTTNYTTLCLNTIKDGTTLITCTQNLNAILIHPSIADAMLKAFIRPETLPLEWIPHFEKLKGLIEARSKDLTAKAL